MTAHHAHPDEPRDECCGDCGKRLSQPDEHESGLCLRCLNGPLPADRVGRPCGVCRGRVVHAPDCPAASRAGQDTTLREEKLRAELARALHGALCSCRKADAGTGFWFRSADEAKALDALLPVVRRYAARELREVAVNYVTREADRELIRARADGLEADA